MPEKELSEIEEFVFSIYLKIKVVRESMAQKREAKEKRKPKLTLLRGGKKEEVK